MKLILLKQWMIKIQLYIFYLNYFFLYENDFYDDDDYDLDYDILYDKFLGDLMVLLSCTSKRCSKFESQRLQWLPSKTFVPRKETNRYEE